MHEDVGYPEHWYIVARFMPKDLETLRPAMVPYIGMEFELSWMGTSGDDEPFPGQHRWGTTREFEERINMSKEARGRWIPNEDLQGIRPRDVQLNSFADVENQRAMDVLCEQARQADEDHKDT